MALDMMSLLGAVMGSGMASSSNKRVSNAASALGSLDLGSGLQGLLGGLLSGGQAAVSRAGAAVGGTDNLAAAGIGALLGALSGKQSTTLNGLGGGMMGLLGMMAYKALSGAGAGGNAGIAASLNNRTAQQTASDAEVILTAMIDAAKADGQVDADELSRITGHIKSSGLGQEGMNYILAKLQAPMETSKIVAATQGRPELAAQVYSASLMAIEVDTQAERLYLDRLAKAMGLSAAVVKNIEQLTGA